ncbi:MAG: TonB-dependent receptor plug domain-containing protein [Saprospiraceae bacterium]
MDRKSIRNIDLSQIDLCNVDHIEIVEGPMSVVYGSNALGGVVNIITRSGASENIHNTLNIYYESVGMYNINDDFTLRKGKYNFGLNIGRNFFDGYDTDLSTRSMEYKPKESYNASIKNNYLLKHGEIKLQNSLFLENLLDRSDISFTPYSAKGYDTWYRTIRSINTLEFKKEFANNSNFSVIADYSYYDRTKLKYLKDLTTLETTLTQGKQ